MCCWGPDNNPGNGPACSLTLAPVTDQLVTQNGNWPTDCYQKACQNFFSYIEFRIGLGADELLFISLNGFCIIKMIFVSIS